MNIKNCFLLLVPPQIHASVTANITSVTASAISSESLKASLTAPSHSWTCSIDTTIAATVARNADGFLYIDQMCPFPVRARGTMVLGGKVYYMNPPNATNTHPHTQPRTHPH